MNTFVKLCLLTIPILPNLWCIWHASRHEFPTPSERKLWMRMGVLLPVLGGFIYLFFGLRRAQPMQQ